MRSVVLLVKAWKIAQKVYWVNRPLLQRLCHDMVMHEQFKGQKPFPTSWALWLF
jgi:hypothetical protein